MEWFMKDSEKMIYRKDKEKKSGRMELIMKEVIKKGKKMDLDSFFGGMDHSIILIFI
jgi:hypothetical protein